MKIMILLALLLLTGCNTLRNVSNSDSFFKNKIDVSVCTKANPSVKQHRSSRYKKIENYYLDLGFYGEIPVGTKMTIVKVYRLDVFAGSTYYIVLAKIDMPYLEDKLVDIAELYGPRSDDLHLDAEHAEYC